MMGQNSQISKINPKFQHKKENLGVKMIYTKSSLIWAFIIIIKKNLKIVLRDKMKLDLKVI